MRFINQIVIVMCLFSAGCATQSSRTIKPDAPFPMPAINLPVIADRDFVVTQYNAVEGTDISISIGRAIDACSAAGGGRVVIPAGKWRTKTIHLKSNINLHLAKDAVLTFSGDPNDYLPAVQSSWEGFECFNYSPLIYAFECENVALTGEGMLTVEMETWTEWFARPPAHMEALKKLYTMVATSVPVEQRQMAEGENHLRPQFIQFNRCKNVLIDGLTIRESPFWTIHLLLCDSVIVRGLDIKAHGHNNDGVDPEMTRNLLIENCTFDQGDDAIVVKAGSNQDGWRLNVPSENIVIRNCTVIAGHQLLAIGSEISAGIRNVYAHDCRFVNDKADVRNLLFIKTNHRRGGFVENIYLENITASKIAEGVFGVNTDALFQWRDSVPTYETRISKISGIHVKNVTVGESGTPVKILGDARQPVRDVFIENIHVGKVTGEKESIKNATNVNLSKITIDQIVQPTTKKAE